MVCNDVMLKNVNYLNIVSRKKTN